MRVWGPLLLVLLGARSGELPERELAASPYGPAAKLAPNPYLQETLPRALAPLPQAPSYLRVVGSSLALAPSPYELAPAPELAPSPYDLSLAPDPYVDLTAAGTTLGLTSLPPRPSSLRSGAVASRSRPALAPSPYELGPPLGLAPNPY